MRICVFFFFFGSCKDAEYVRASLREEAATLADGFLKRYLESIRVRAGARVFNIFNTLRKPPLIFFFPSFWVLTFSPTHRVRAE